MYTQRMALVILYILIS